MPEGRPVSEMDIQEAEIVVYVISRISGEGKDRRLEKGDYYLSEREEKDILFLNSRCVPIVLLINAGGPVELTDILEKAQWIKGILNISKLGQEGGRAVARILLGEAVPSGKLTTTWAKKYADVPFAENFSYLNGNLELEEYKEGIYVGYRYFDSFGVEPLFPFGFGLSSSVSGTDASWYPQSILEEQFLHSPERAELPSRNSLSFGAYMSSIAFIVSSE